LNIDIVMSNCNRIAYCVGCKVVSSDIALGIYQMEVCGKCKDMKQLNESGRTGV